MEKVFLLSSKIEPVLTFVSSRIKYTCLDVSENYLLFGTNNGCIYVFEKKKYDLIRLISNLELRGPIKQVKISPTEDTIAVATNIIFVMKINLHERNSRERIIHKIIEHRDADISHLSWSNELNHWLLFSADKLGFIYVTDLNKVFIMIFNFFYSIIISRFIISTYFEI